jgi:hypothetical protein
MATHASDLQMMVLLRHYNTELHRIFKHYAAADQTSTEALAALDSMNLPEFLFMLREGGLIDDKLTVSQVGHIFTQVNAASEDADDGDTNDAECVYEEFLQVIGRICDARISASSREDPEEELVYTLQRWLHLIFIPTYTRLLKDKARGIGSKTL